MPVTKGSGNPNWTRDETLLALDLLYRHDAKPLDRSSGEVADLSRLLKSAQLHPIEGRKDNFRNTDGVALKLQNLLSALVPGRGLSSSKTDREVVSAFPQSARDRLAGIAAAIRAELETGSPIADVPDDEVFVEGRVITVQHRARDRRLRLKLLAGKSDNALVCEICSFEPPPITRSLRESFFEAHHIVPLATVEISKTRVADMALLCAGCHRFIHRLISSRARWIGIGEGRAVLAGPHGS